MVKRLIELAGKAAGTAKSVLFADPNLLYKEERHLVNQPFFFEGANNKAVVLVHGWTSTPYELRRLGRYLNENGYTVQGVQLTGHGTVPKDLENVPCEQWVADVETAVKRLANQYAQVYIAGTSIGANLATIVAAQSPNVAGVVLMAMPFAIKQEKIVLPFAKLLLRLRKKYRKKFYPPTFGLATTITRLISYQTYPVKSVLESFKLVQQSRAQLPRVTQPALVMQSTSDHIVSRGSLENICAKLGSEVKRKKYISKAYHTFISDIRNEHVFEDILQFLNEN